MFSPDGTLISASAAPHCGDKRGETKRQQDADERRARRKNSQAKRHQSQPTDAASATKTFGLEWAYTITTGVARLPETLHQRRKSMTS